MVRSDLNLLFSSAWIYMSGIYQFCGHVCTFECGVVIRPAHWVGWPCRLRRLPGPHPLPQTHKARNVGQRQVGDRHAVERRPHRAGLDGWVSDCAGENAAWRGGGRIYLFLYLTVADLFSPFDTYPTTKYISALPDLCSAHLICLQPPDLRPNHCSHHRECRCRHMGQIKPMQKAKM